MTGSGIHHFAAQSKLASISEEFPGDCFDFDHLSASSLGGSVLKHKQKEAVSRLWEDFPFCESISAPRCIFKRIARRILSTPANSEIFTRSCHNYFPRKNLTTTARQKKFFFHEKFIAGHI